MITHVRMVIVGITHQKGDVAVRKEVFVVPGECIASSRILVGRCQRWISEWHIDWEAHKIDLGVGGTRGAMDVW
jgi:hypothetical protein